MKKSILTIAVAAASTMVATSAMAAPTVYGNVHVSINGFSDGTAVKTASGNAGSGSKDLDMTSNTSAIGLKGSEDLGDGMKAIYKAEFQMDPADAGANGNALTSRDMFAGLKGGWGTVKFGTYSSNYKQMGGKVDSLYRTRLEGRGFLNTQSAQLHGGRGINRGRSTNTIQYVSPKMAGVSLVVNTTTSGADSNIVKESTGAGVRWSNKSILAYLDWISTDDGSGTGNAESAVKLGAAFKSKAFHIGGQFEDAEDLTAYSFIHVNGGFNFNKNNSIELTVGQASHINDGNQDTTGIAVAYNHKLSKMTNVYIGYGDRSSDSAALEDSLFTAGIKKKF